jgi:hypothetical protein
MKLSSEQVQLFWREWSKSCQIMNWTRAAGLTSAEIDVKRKSLLRDCGFDSLTKVDRVDGFTKVLNELRVLQGTSLKAGIESEDQTINRSRTLRYSIAAELIPCLELYLENVPEYLSSIMEDKNRWWKIDRPTRDITIMDLTTTQLTQFRFTLNARMHTLRKKAGHSIHDMKTRALVPCICSICRSAEARKSIIAEMASEPQLHEA